MYCFCFIGTTGLKEVAMPNTILVPFDGSESAMRALRFAVERLREKPQGRVHLVTVHSPLRVYGEIQVYMGDKKAAEMAAQHNREILEPAEQVLRSSGVAFESSTAEGDAAEKIVECATAVGADEIVMGSRGLGRIAGLVMGSITTKVVHLTPLPVTLVK
jgi:nucleotide-binding universal stress UspA family protein